MIRFHALALLAVLAIGVSPVRAEAESPAPVNDPVPVASVAPPPAAPAPIAIHLDRREARELLAALDVAIKASGYSPTSVAALKLGERVERAFSTVGAPPAK